MHERIAAETQALLDRPDVAGYCVLWVARARGRGPRSSLPAAPVPGQSGFETRAADEPALGAGAVRAVADALLEVLEEEPREPVMLNLAGVARYELGALGPAERLFKAALRLDPALPQVRRTSTRSLAGGARTAAWARSRRRYAWRSRASALAPSRVRRGRGRHRG